MADEAISKRNVRLKYKILKVIFAVWVALWAWFIIRELFVKDNIDSYRALLKRPLEGKRSYVTGDRLYEFLTFARSVIPDGATYKFAGIEEGSIERIRAAYYLYPRIESAAADYIIVYGASNFHDERYVMLKGMDSSRYILKRLKGK